jgi:hypothetical protein
MKAITLNLLNVAAVVQNRFRFLKLAVIGCGLIGSVSHSNADPLIDSWFTRYSAKYARLYTSAAAQTSGTAVTTWSNGSQTQALPAYCGVQEVYSSSNWVYIRTTGLGSHVLGPWPVNFPNWPVNKKILYSLPRNPTVPATKVLTGLGAIGYFVDGVSMFDTRDAFYWNGTTEVTGTGNWNRDAYVNESATFDPAYAHQENTGTYHYHANPIALRYLLGDHVDFNSGTKTYSESTGPVTKHSPLLGWVRDGYPVYGPYGYANASNAASGVRRMISGYVLRNGQFGSQNLSATGRTAIPAWAVRLYNVSSNQPGPSVSGTYPLGRYLEDNDYLGDLGKVQGVDFDLNEYNGRFCVTPEYPNGTYAYFVCITSNGAPAFPYNIGRAFYGNPSGASATVLNEAVTTNYLGGANAGAILNRPTLAEETVTLSWSAVEGGTYSVESSTNLATWSVLATNIAAQQTLGQTTDAKTGGKFYRVGRTALASYDGVSSGGTGNGILSVSPNAGTHGTTLTITINLNPAAQPAPPPQNAPINSVTVGTITGVNNVHVSQTQVTSSITIPGNASGPQTVTVVFPGPPANPTQTVTYTLVDGFTIN